MDSAMQIDRGIQELVTLAGLIGVVVVLVVLFLWGLRNPVIWRLLSVFAVAGGVGLLVWGIMAAALGEETTIGSPTGLVGIGAGTTAGGIMLLVISFLGPKRA